MRVLVSGRKRKKEHMPSLITDIKGGQGARRRVHSMAQVRWDGRNVEF